MKYIFIFIFAVTLSNCKKEKSDNILNVTIDNKSNSNLSNIKLFTNIGITNNTFTDSLTIDLIDPNQIYTTNWKINNLSNTDGNFILIYHLNSKKTEKEFGYFSNGNLITDKYKLIITNDTILVE